MKRTGMILVVSAAGLCACAPAGTELTIDAPGEPGAVVSYAGRSVTLDANGHGALVAPVLHTVLSGFGAGPGAVDLVDAAGQRLVLRVEWRGQSVDTPPICVPYYSAGGPVERAALRLRRVLADGSCRMVNPSLVQDGVERAGSYEPVNFDDAPCGPFTAAR
jgi:hypothetical protein